MPSPLPPDHAQRLAAADPSHSVLLTAPAGSGKTSVLLLRFLRCLLCATQPEQVVAITFTNKAAAEIRVRVVEALASASQPLPADANAFDGEVHAAATAVRDRDQQLEWQLQRDAARLRIYTIDSFCGSIVRRLPLLSGMGSASPTDDDTRLFDEAVLSLLRSWQLGQLAAEDAAALVRVLAYGDNRYDRLLPMLSNLLANRDQWLESVLAGRNDFAQVLHALVSARFDALLAALASIDLPEVLTALRQMPAHDEHWGFAAELPPVAELTVDALPLLRRVASGMTKSGDGKLYVAKSLHHKGHGKMPRDEPATAAARDWADRVFETGRDDAAAALFGELLALPDAEVPAGTAQLNRDLARVLRQLLAHLQVTFAETGETDFSETGLRAIQALRGDVDVNIDALLREEAIHHLLVDEMQDTSARQIDLLRALCADWLPDDGRSIFLCGDLMQSIYGFRGAQPQLFEAIAEAGAFGQRALSQLALTANFRSAAAVVDWCNTRFGSLASRGGETGFVSAVPQRDMHGEVSLYPLTAASIDDAEAAEVNRCLQVIREALATDPQAPPSIAVLVRARGQLNALISALREAGISFSSRNAELLRDTPPVRGLLHLLWALWHEADDVAWVGVLREPFVGLGWEDIRRLRAGGCSVPAALSDQALLAQLSDEGQRRCQRLMEVWQRCADSDLAPHLGLRLAAVWHSLGGAANLGNDERAGSERFFQLLDSSLEGGLLKSRTEFERRLEKLHAAPAGGQVQLMSMHSAKGLEFDVVILPQLGRRGRNDDKPLFHRRRFAEGEVMAAQPQPGTLADDATAQQRLFDFLAAAAKEDRWRDELRLLYVACTRARRSLHLIGTATGDPEKGRFTPQHGSLLKLLWPVCEQEFDDAQWVERAQSTPNEDWQPVIAPRMALDAALSRRDRGLRSQRASSALERIELREAVAGLEENIEARAVGLVYHELMDRLAQGFAAGDPQPDTDANREAWRRAALVRLQHHCHPQPELQDSADQVLQLVRNTLQCARGRWILSQSGQAWNEQPVLARHGDLWQRMIFDRLFIDDDCCWIIDYKTVRGRPGDSELLARQVARYADKMMAYRDAAVVAAVAGTVRVALYFPALQHLHVYDT